MRSARALTLIVATFGATIFGVAHGGSASTLKFYDIELAPPPPGFHERMGGLPKEISARTFHAAYGSLKIYAYDSGQTTLDFDFHGLLPYGVYTLWDVIDPDPAHFADRPLANAPQGVDPTTPHWWTSVAFDKDGGPNGFGSFGFIADRRGDAQMLVTLDHRPGKEFLLDYHADGHVRGGEKGASVFPGAVWAQFPQW
jgi:hypothetical protein